jgi:phospholipase C
MKRLARLKAIRAVTLAACTSLVTSPLAASVARATSVPSATTPIEHVVVIFQENVSFDHYFGTYPNAQNNSGETPFKARPGTPTVNGLSGALLTANPNGVNPYRQSPGQAAMCDQDHGYTDEQAMFDSGMMDNFIKFTSDCSSPANPPLPPNQIMDYFDGNTVTAMWNYAQYFALNDNSYNTTFGPSTPGAINLVSGYTGGATQVVAPTGFDDIIAGSIIDDAQPAGDTCTTRDSATMGGTNIGNLLNNAGLTWGWFQGGFDLTITNPNGTTGCARTSTSEITLVTKSDYIPHHEPFQYYASTANPTHARPSSVAAIGTTDAANHQYDIHDFYDALKAGNLPRSLFSRRQAIRTAMPATRIRLMNRPLWSRRSTHWRSHHFGRAPRLLSRMTTRTASTIIR